MVIYATFVVIYIVTVVAQSHLVLYLIIFIRNWVNCCDIIIKYNVDEITLEFTQCCELPICNDRADFSR